MEQDSYPVARYADVQKKRQEPAYVPAGFALKPTTPKKDFPIGVKNSGANTRVFRIKRRLVFS